jgi:thioredoxin-like negative regulator of GroEL
MPIENISSPGKFQAAIKNNKKVLVLYYWKDCGYCKTLIPTWNQVVHDYADKLNIAQIEWDVIKKLNEADQITSFPTIAVFKNGKVAAYMTSERNEKNLHKFIRDNMLPKSKKKRV